MTSESIYVTIVLVRGNKMEKEIESTPDHDCYDHAVQYEFYEDERRYHGWECAQCGELLQTG